MYVQSVTPEEFALAKEAMSCPTDSIGKDG
jgi:hypothetical protein